MGYGSNQAARDAEDGHRERRAQQIAHYAAQLVAAGDMGRTDAIREVTEWMRREDEASGDVTGTASMENKFPFPSKDAPKNQVAAIETKLLEAARTAADTL